MKTKFCSSCQTEKPATEFYSYCLARCKLCTIKQVAKYQAKHKARHAEYGKKYGILWRQRHPEYNKKWRHRNCRRLRDWYREYYQAKRATSVNWVLSNGMGRRLRQLLNSGSNSGKGGRHWEKLLGYTIEDLRKHIERQFTVGMSWEMFLRGKIHIDHRVPIAFFEYQKPEDWEFQYCWSLDNLQPLWATDNRKKSDKINGISRKRKSFSA